jgi:hypothetical protein
MKPDLFAEAREAYSIADAWQMLRLPGEPKASCRSPFRDDHSPSFTVFDDGKAWKDHATGDGGDVIEFIRFAIGGDHRAVRDWLKERIGIDLYDHGDGKTPCRPAKAPDAPKRIEWPAEIVEGNSKTWGAFAKRRGLTYPATWAMVKAGILRFTRIEGIAHYVVTDATGRAAEIRRLDGKPCVGDSKAFPLKGVDKSWLPGLDLLHHAPKKAAVMIVEGSTDLLTSLHLYSRYHRDHGGTTSWVPAAVLGASCRNLHAEGITLIRGRRCRIVPDADPSGDKMAEHWSGLLRSLGCTVDIVDLPRGTDLTDCKNDISPIDLFSL